MMLKGKNSASSSEQGKPKNKIHSKTLPDDVVIEPYLDRTHLVKRAINTVKPTWWKRRTDCYINTGTFFCKTCKSRTDCSFSPIFHALCILSMMNLFGVSAPTSMMSQGLLISTSCGWRRNNCGSNTPLSGSTSTAVKAESENNEPRCRHKRQKMMNSAAFGQIII